MVLSVILGALLYIFIQLAWYSPLGFGKRWLLLQDAPPEETLEKIAQTNTFSSGIQALFFPALLMSMAINALFIVLERFESQFFFGATLGLFLLTAGKKYLSWQKADRKVRKGWYIHDGALFVSLSLLALLCSCLLG